MPPIEWNGPDLKYVIEWTELEPDSGNPDDARSDTLEVGDPEVYHQVINAGESFGIYKPYRVTVKAKNTVGESSTPAEPVIGYSGGDSKWNL